MSALGSFFQCFQADQYYFIIIIIGLTFVAEVLCTLREVLKSRNPGMLNENVIFTISYKNFFDFAFILAFLLIIVDLLKIVFGWDIVWAFNIDMIIKIFLCANIGLTVLIVYFITRRGIKEIYVEKQIIKPLYPPDETSNLKDHRAIS